MRPPLCSDAAPLAAWLALAAALGCGGSSRTEISAQTIAAADSAIEAEAGAYLSALAAVGDFAGEVLLARGDSLLYHARVGAAADSSAVALRYPLASLTKSLTAAAILRLVTDGRVGLDDPVARHVPSFPAGDGITIRMLLSHTSGLPNESSFPDFVERLNEPLTLQENVARLAARPLDFPPGSRGAYSNSGYLLLAHVIERVSGQTYAAFVDSVLLRPLGIREIEPAAVAARAGRLAQGHFVGPPPSYTTPGAPVEFSHNIGSGSYSATADALYRWTRAALRDSTLGIRERPFGWGTNRRLGRRTYEQTGNLPGYLAITLWFEEEDLHVILLSSIQSAMGFFRAPAALAAMALGESYDSPPYYRPQQLGAGLGRAAAGTYRDPTGARMEIVDRSGDVYIRFPPSRWPYGDTYLTPTGDSTLFARTDDATIRLMGGPQGVTGITWMQSGSETRWTRVP